MAIITTRFYSICVGGYVNFTAVLPFEDFGDDFLKPNVTPYELKQPMRTLYLLHGMTGDDKDWLYSTNIERYAKENKIAVIMPAGGNNFYVDKCPIEKWGEFVGKELVEFTRNLLPLSCKRQDTYIGGLSMGGYGAIRNGLKYAETFSKILALSSALITYDIPFSTEVAHHAWQKKSYYEKIFGDVNKVEGSDCDPEALYLECEYTMDIFMTIGRDDFLIEQNRRFKEFLQKQNANLFYYEEEGAHEWDFWDRNIKRGVEWLSEMNDPKR